MIRGYPTVEYSKYPILVYPVRTSLKRYFSRSRRTSHRVGRTLRLPHEGTWDSYPREWPSKHHVLDFVEALPRLVRSLISFIPDRDTNIF